MAFFSFSSKWAKAGFRVMLNYFKINSAIASCATFLFLPYFDVICDLSLNRRTATWNLFVNYCIVLYCIVLYVWVIDQVWGQDGWILAKSFFCDGVFERTNLVNKGFIIWLSGKFFMLDTAGSPERARWLDLARSGSQSHRAIWFILPARGASHIIIYCTALHCIALYCIVLYCMLWYGIVLYFTVSHPNPHWLG